MTENEGERNQVWSESLTPDQFAIGMLEKTVHDLVQKHNVGRHTIKNALLAIADNQDFLAVYEPDEK